MLIFRFFLWIISEVPDSSDNYTFSISIVTLSEVEVFRLNKNINSNFKNNFLIKSGKTVFI